MESPAAEAAKAHMAEAAAPATEPADESAKASARRKVIVLLIVASAMFMEQLDGTVLATALPDMSKFFGVDPLRMNVALTAYLLTLAMFIPASGKIADRFGSRTVFRAAIGCFTVGSILCAQAPTLWALVAARMLQGAGGALMSPVGRLVMLRVVSKSELVRAMSWLMLPATIGPIVGPPLGGFLVTYLSWHWIFYINVPIGLAGMVAVSLYIEQMKEEHPRPFDLRGLALAGSALAFLMFGLEMASRGVGSIVMIVLLFGVGGASAAGYTWHARHHPHPMLEFSLLRIPTMRLSMACGSLSRIAVGAMPFLMPMMFQLGFGYSAAQSGIITFASSIGSLAVRPVAPGIIRRMGFRAVLIWIGAIATLLLAAAAGFRPDWPMWSIYALLIVIGFFQSLQFMAYNTIAYADVSREEMSAATSFYTTFQQTALSVGIATSAAALAFSIRINGHPHAELSDFTASLLFVCAVSMLAPLLAITMDKNAGAEMSGHYSRSAALAKARLAARP